MHRYSGFVADYDAAYNGVKAGIMEAFYGPPHKGVYSPSVQFTLMEMGKAVLARCAFSALLSSASMPCTQVAMQQGCYSCAPQCLQLGECICAARLSTKWCTVDFQTVCNRGGQEQYHGGLPVQGLSSGVNLLQPAQHPLLTLHASDQQGMCRDGVSPLVCILKFWVTG